MKHVKLSAVKISYNIKKKTAVGSLLGSEAKAENFKNEDRFFFFLRVAAQNAAQ